MHPMPREGTETQMTPEEIERAKMHPMPREGTETYIYINFDVGVFNASYAP